MAPYHLPLDAQYASMPWDEIDTVVFDVGNVLVAFQPQRILEEVFPGEPEKHALLLDKVFHSPCWIMLDRGTLSLDEAADAMAGLDKSLRPDIRHLLDAWADLKHPIPEGVETLRLCKAKGKRCLILSNYRAESFRQIEEKFDFFRLADGMVISSRVHMLKPTAEIYHYLLDHFRLDGNRTLFIDDAPANIEGALRCGIQGLCFNAPGKLKRFFGF